MSKRLLQFITPRERIVLDTSVVVSALRSPGGTSAELLAACLDGQYAAVIAPALFLEYEVVLYRPEHRLNPDVVALIIEQIAAVFLPTRVDFNWRPQLRDPDDELVLEAAINGKAEILATHNVRDFLPAANNFGIRVLTPGVIISQRSSR